MNFLFLLLQHLPAIIGVVQTVEAVATKAKTLPSSAAKLQAATTLACTIIPVIAQAIQADAANGKHLENVINGAVATVNALDAWTNAG